MKRKLILGALLVLALGGLGTASYAFLINNNQTSTQGTEPRLLVQGLVQHPLNLTLDEIKTLPSTAVNAPLICVGNPTTPIGGGNWTGVTLAYLLLEAGVKETAVKVAFYASDGYTTDLTVQGAQSENIIVAYQLNGARLKENLRLVVPGRFGYKWISNLVKIELVDYDFKGKWETSGYSDEGLIP